MNCMKTLLVTLCLFAVTVCHGQKFVHPGMLHTATDLQFLKAKVAAGEEPWKSAWEELKASPVGQLDYKATPWKVVSNGSYNRPDNGGSDFVRDGDAAYTMALRWYVEGEKAYAEKAIEIFNAWSSTLDSVVNHNRQLKVGTGGIKYLNAAEILKCYYKGWKAKDQKAFQDMVLGIWYPVIKDWVPNYNGNWDASIGQTMLCMGVMYDRRDIFDRAYNQLYNGETNGSIKNYFYANGQCQESGRDQQHVQMGIGFLVCACEIAWNQGLDLYSAFDNRLAKGYEYTAKYMLGEEVPYEQYKTFSGRLVFGPEISASQRDVFMPVWERAFRHYNGRMGLEMPYTRRAVAKSRPEGWGVQSFIPWSTLTTAGFPADNR